MLTDCLYLTLHLARAAALVLAAYVFTYTMLLLA